MKSLIISVLSFVATNAFAFFPAPAPTFSRVTGEEMVVMAEIAAQYPRNQRYQMECATASEELYCELSPGSILLTGENARNADYFRRKQMTPGHYYYISCSYEQATCYINDQSNPPESSTIIELGSLSRSQS